MDKQVYGILEAAILLKEGTILKDTSSTFIYKKKRVYVYSSNSSFNLDISEFKNLYKDSKFVVYSGEDSGIDGEKDKEYYGFKHK